MLDCMMSDSQRAMRSLIGPFEPSARDTRSTICRRPECCMIVVANCDKRNQLVSPSAPQPIYGSSTNMPGAGGRSLSIGGSECRPGGLPFDGGRTRTRCARSARRWLRRGVSTKSSARRTDVRSSYEKAASESVSTQVFNELPLFFQGQAIGSRVG